MRRNKASRLRAKRHKEKRALRKRTCIRVEKVFMPEAAFGLSMADLRVPPPVMGLSMSQQDWDAACGR